MTMNELTAAGGHAFPTDGEYGAYTAGMTLRDYFAAAALSGIVAAHSGETALPADDKAARWSYQAADAMLAERVKPRPGTPA